MSDLSHASPDITRQKFKKYCFKQVLVRQKTADMSMVTFGKPTEHVPLPDWYARTWEMCQTADTLQSDALNLRAEGRQLRSETSLKTKWDTYHNDARLHDRHAMESKSFTCYDINVKDV